MKDSSGEKESRILDFYTGLKCDDAGRNLTEIQKWPDETLEAVHDFIQWLFPLKERSAFNPDAPLLDPHTIAKFHSTPELRLSLRRSLVRMLEFYGLKLQGDSRPRVERGPNYKDRSGEWLSPGDHNHLRITRIIRSVRLLGLELEGKAFFDCLNEIYEEEQTNLHQRITKETLSYWKSAAHDTV